MKKGFIKAGDVYLRLTVDFVYYKTIYTNCILLKPDLLDLAKRTRKKMQVLRIVLKELYKLNGIIVRTNEELKELLRRDKRKGTIHLVKIAKIKEAYKKLENIKI